MFGAEFVKRVPVRDRNGNHRHDSIGRPMFKQVYDPPASHRANFQHDREERGIRRTDVSMSHASENFGKEASRRYEAGLDHYGAKVLLAHANQQGWDKQLMRERIPNAWSKDEATRKKGTTARQTIYSSIARVQVQNELAARGIVDQGARERNYWSGFTQQVGQGGYNTNERHQIGDALEFALSNRAHPNDRARLANSVDIRDLETYGNRLRKNGYIRDAAPKPKYTRREVIQAAYDYHSRPKVYAMNGRVAAKPE